ncbi:hypothetical protein ZIOFF_009194 [Zingiber officinale]|uniref:Uncharacterized protein n=1 Tax=Zingiber officinale TaxID=94328 RepID=A0A8J5LIW2_ZINOF|nr:hypothetical protein ZIOFF_009194 [Zingiber officinale]
MGRGVSCGGGQSSLGYLFGNGDAPKSAGEPAESVEKPAPKSAGEPAESVEKPAPKSAEPVQQSAPATQVDNKQIPAGIQGNLANNYQRSDGQNCGNFITFLGGGNALDHVHILLDIDILELILNSSPSRIAHQRRCKLLRAEALPWASSLATAAASEEKWKSNLSSLLTFCVIGKRLGRVLLYSFMLTMLLLKFNGHSAVFYHLTNEKSIPMGWIVVLYFIEA